MTCADPRLDWAEETAALMCGAGDTAGAREVDVADAESVERMIAQTLSD